MASTHDGLYLVTGLSRVMQDFTADISKIIERGRYRRIGAEDAAKVEGLYRIEEEIAWEAYERHENNGHILPSELCWAEGLNEYEEGDE